MPASKPRKVGRPMLPRGNAKAVMLRVRVTPKELKTFETAAKASNQNISEWIRSTINASLSLIQYKMSLRGRGDSNTR